MGKQEPREGNIVGRLCQERARPVQDADAVIRDKKVERVEIAVTDDLTTARRTDSLKRPAGGGEVGASEGESPASRAPACGRPNDRDSCTVDPTAA